MAYEYIRKNGMEPPFSIPTTNAEKENTEIGVVCDSDNDLSSVGTKWRPGSWAIIPGEGAKILNASEEWK